MKAIRFIISVCVGAGMLVFLVVVVPTYFHDRARLESRNSGAALQRSFNQIREASEAFSRDQRGRGSTPPTTVSLRELIAAGYFHSKEAEALRSHEVLVTIVGSDEATTATVGKTNVASERALARTELGNGFGLTLFFDGSVESHSTRLTNKDSIDRSARV